MDVSIILLTYNSGDTISECLDNIELSIKNSKLMCELIIVDGSSSDNTLMILNRKSIHTKLISANINDRSISFNKGVSLAKGKYICRVDSRSLLPKEYIGKCFNFLQHNIEYFNVGGMMVPSNMHAQIECLYKNLISFGNSDFRFAESDKNVDTVYLGFFKKDLFLEFGGYDDNFGFINEETDLNFQAKQRGYSIRLLHNLKIKYITRNKLKDYLLTMRRYGAARSGFFIKNKNLSLKLILFLLFYGVTLLNLFLYLAQKDFIFITFLIIQFATLYYFFIKSLRSNYLSFKVSKTFLLFFHIILGHFNWILGFVIRLFTSKNKYN